MKPIYCIRHNSIEINRILSRYGNSHELAYFDDKFDQIHWTCLSLNTSDRAIELLEQNPDKIHWYNLSSNPNAIHILKKNIDKIDKIRIHCNPNGIEIIKDHIDTLDTNGWNQLSLNPKAISILEQNLDKIDWYNICRNPAAKSLILQNKNRIDWHYLACNNYYNHPDEFRDIISSNLDKIDPNILSCIPDAVQFLEFDKINWVELSANHNAVHLLEKYPEKIDWSGISVNSKAIHILEKNINKIKWNMIYHNKNPGIFRLIEKYCPNIIWNELVHYKNAIPLLSKNVSELNDIGWKNLCGYSYAIDLLMEHFDKIKDHRHLLWNNQSPRLVLKLDYKQMKEKNQYFTEELVSKVFHPKRLLYICKEYHIKFVDIHDYY